MESSTVSTNNTTSFQPALVDDNSSDELILSVYDTVQRIAHRYERPASPTLSHEDLVAEAMVEVIHAARVNLPKASPPAQGETDNKQGYLTRAARYTMADQCSKGDPLGRSAHLKTIQDCLPVLSLDAEFDETGGSLYDVVAANSPATPTNHSFPLLSEAINRLSFMHGQVICMHFGLGGYGSHRLCEIADLLDIPYGIVTSRLRNGLSQLRKVLAEGQVDDPFETRPRKQRISIVSRPAGYPELSAFCEQEEVKSMINALKVKQRQAFCMRYGLFGNKVHIPYEIGVATGVSRKTAFTRIRLATEKLSLCHPELLRLVEEAH